MNSNWMKAFPSFSGFHIQTLFISFDEEVSRAVVSYVFGIVNVFKTPVDSIKDNSQGFLVVFFFYFFCLPTLLSLLYGLHFFLSWFLNLLAFKKLYRLRIFKQKSLHSFCFQYIFSEQRLQAVITKEIFVKFL